ncbi:chorion peroxidase-like [Spodoptera litura]|uniref:Chorion peroxidase-like n=1 Tax=Spodoptera litura TaxID=69820 RepID=A0A9J7DZQ9_SPOLT|nr:chorion peroxidase-like [Spodoptera litura]
MMQASSSSERTPLVQPTYVFESSLARRYQKRLHHMQCVMCVFIIAILMVALLVTISYNLSQDMDDDITTEPSEPALPIPGGNLTLLKMSPGMASSGNPGNLTLVNGTLMAMPPALQPLLDLKWPLKGQPPAAWASTTPSKAQIASALLEGKAALKEKTKAEWLRRPLDMDTPANRAQRAAATSADVKPLADSAYAAEIATKALMNGTDISLRPGGAGEGPPLNGSFPEPPYCSTTPIPCTLSRYRTTDGTCNNLENPLRWGVSKTPFRRVLPADYGDGVSSPRQGVDGAALPSARDVSVTVHRPSYAHDSAFTVMLAVWGQFVDHDITATALSKGQNGTALSCCDPTQTPHPECFPVQLDVDDPFYQDYNITCMEFVRSAPAPTCHFGPREQLNQATAFIDASTVYGFAEARSASLRSFVGGQLRMLKIGATQLLPPSTDPNDSCNTAEMNAKGRYCFESGDDRANENLHLTTMHLIWARQHNRVAAALRKYNPLWDDDTVYQEARKILGAQMQHITYSEFLPSILGSDVMWALNMTVEEEGYSDVYDPTVDPSIANHFASCVFRFAHTLLPGLIHNTDKSTGTIQYTHLHQMLFNPYTLYTKKGPIDAVTSAMATLVHAVDPHVTTELSNHLFEKPVIANTSDADDKKPGPCGLDLVSLNIQRGRDHGLPAYPQWREHCGLSRPKNFTDLQAIFDESSLSRICKIYNSVDDIDLYTGALAEDPKGRLLGPTLTCLIADQFYRIKVGDRFWYESSDPTLAFTLEQLAEIRKTTLAGVICANEDLLDQAQPRVMEAVSATNPLVDCKELPQPNLKAWGKPKASKTTKS